MSAANDWSLILPTPWPGTLFPERKTGDCPTSIWKDWFFAGNNVPTTPNADGLLTKTKIIVRAADKKAEADYAASSRDRMHLGQHDNGRPGTIRPQNTPWVEIRGRLLHEEA